MVILEVVEMRPRYHSCTNATRRCRVPIHAPTPVEGSPKLPAGYHQFVDSKAPWLEICDGLPQFPGSVDD
jgi:hypothetical protein